MNPDALLMQEALADAGRALNAGEFPVGCVMARGEEIVARGRRAHSRGEEANEMDHAEISALRQLLDRPEIPPAAVTVYATMEPCLMCYTTLLLNGVRRFVYAYEDVMGGGTDLVLADLKPLYRQMRVEVVPHVRRAESLKLFRAFFADPDNDYWPDSLLAEYTLKQP